MSGAADRGPGVAMTRRSLLGAAAVASLADAAPAGAAGPALLDLVHTGGRRTRYRMAMPDRGGRWPVVLFSHGANASSAAYDRLWDVWAAHGFAVIGPDHIDSGPPADGLWASRMADLSLPLRARAAFDRAARARGGRLDWDAVAAAGHSLGAVVAQGLAGARLTDTVSPAPSDARQPAVRACLAFSPPGPHPGSVPDDAWATVAVPSLLQTGDADILPGFVDDWRARLTGFGAAPGRWTYVGHGVDHYFGGLICRLSPAAGGQSRALDAAAILSATFLAATLNGDRDALRRLEARARTGDDGVGIFAAAGGQPAEAAARHALGRRQLVRVGLAFPLFPLAAVIAAEPAAPIFPPSDMLTIPGVGWPAPFAPAGRRAPVAPHAIADAQAFSDGLGGTALLVSVGGALVHERYAPGFDAATRLKTYSMAKSVLAIVYGLAVAQGVVRLDDRLGDHVAEFRGDPRGAITLRQLLQMRSGLKLESLGRRDPRAIELVVGRRVTRIALETPLAGVPGAVFEYNNVNSFLAGLALDRALAAAGKGRYAAFLSRALWQPLGQSDATLEVEFAPAGEPRFFAGLDASARDWLRLGGLFVDRGRSGGRRLVPAAWLKAMTTPSGNPSYGLQMWIGDPWTPQRRYGPNTPSAVPCREPYLARDLVFFDGSGGQRVYMVPSRRLVIVRTGAASPAWEDSTLPNIIIRGMA